MRSLLRVPVPVLALVPLLSLACDEGESDDADPGGTTDAAVAAITLSGTLVAGAQPTTLAPRILPSSLPAFAPASLPAALESGDPLAGYQLYCVTFATPPGAASGTADESGAVSLEIDAAGVPFGCFVLDADGEGVAALLFSSGTEQGQTITLTGDADLGTITVDLGNGVAMTEIGNAGTLTGSDDLPCPLGAWVIDVPREDCIGMASVTTWIVKTETGDYRVSFTIGPIRLPGTEGVCGYRSEADLPATWDDGTLTFSILNDPNCAVVLDTLVMTPNAACTEIAIESTVGPCAACNEGGCGCGEGELLCKKNFTAFRE